MDAAFKASFAQKFPARRKVRRVRIAISVTTYNALLHNARVKDFNI